MSFTAGAERLKEAILDLLFPPRCVGCGAWGSFLCSSCCVHLSHLPTPGAACQETHLFIDGIHSAYLMEGAVREAIHRLKYRNLRALARPLGRLLADYIEAAPLLAEVIVPVPLHRRRLRERGYNQSALLAREMGRIVGLPLVEGCLARWRDTQAQARTLSAAERHSNVDGAFHCRDGRLATRSIILIDDVYTTGATLDACAAALKESGAAAVWGLTLAREA